MSAGEFIEAPPGKDCSKFDGGWGTPMTDYEFIWYGNIDEDKYPDDACKLLIIISTHRLIISKSTPTFC